MEKNTPKTVVFISALIFLSMTIFGCSESGTEFSQEQLTVEEYEAEEDLLADDLLDYEYPEQEIFLIGGSYDDDIEYITCDDCRDAEDDVQAQEADNTEGSDTVDPAGESEDDSKSVEDEIRIIMINRDITDDTPTQGDVFRVKSIQLHQKGRTIGSF